MQNKNYAKYLFLISLIILSRYVMSFNFYFEMHIYSYIFSFNNSLFNFDIINEQTIKDNHNRHSQDNFFLFLINIPWLHLRQLIFLD